MNRKLIKFSTLSALALSLVMWGCDSLSESALTGPSDVSENLIIRTDDDGYTVARETNPTVGAVTAVVGQNGGALLLGKHYLTIPAGAVDGPTTFTMTKATDQLRVELTATRLLPNDVGHAGFPVPLTLGLSYHDASNLPDPSLLKMLWANPSGTDEVQLGNVELDKKIVVGSVNHFSGFYVAFPE